MVIVHGSELFRYAADVCEVLGLSYSSDSRHCEAEAALVLFSIMRMIMMARGK